MFQRLKKWWNTRHRYYQNDEGYWVVERWYTYVGWSKFTEELSEKDAIETIIWWIDFDKNYAERLKKKKNFTPTYRYL